MLRERFRYGPHSSQFGDLYRPDRPDPTGCVVLIHGGFWQASFSLEELAAMAEQLCQQGCVVWNIEYRRVGEPGGGWPGTLTDTREAIEHLTTLNQRLGAFPLESTVFLGHSAGGHLALWAAGQDRAGDRSLGRNGPLTVPPVGVVSLAGVSDLRMMWERKPEKATTSTPVRELIGGPPGEFPERYEAASPAEMLPLGTPQWLFHGTHDVRVPLEISVSYARRATREGDRVHLDLIPEADHFVHLDLDSPAWSKIQTTVLRLLESNSTQ